jgi:imidazolonepropionase-like amidohydrolase
MLRGVYDAAMMRTSMISACTLLSACSHARVEPAGTGAAAPGQGRRILFRGARVFDGVRVHHGLEVLVAGSTIAEVGQHVTAAGATVVDGTGQTLMPGLVDSHFHTASREMLRAALVFGVTTVADMNGDELRLDRLRAVRGTSAADHEADVFGAGRLLTASGGHGVIFGGVVVASPEACRAAVAERVAADVDWIKIAVEDGSTIAAKPLPALDDHTIAVCVDAAHTAGRKVYAHVSTVHDARRAIAAGVDGLVHGFTDEVPDQALVDLMVARKVFVVPTLITFLAMSGHGVGPQAISDPAFTPFLDAGATEALSATIPPDWGYDGHGIRGEAQQESVRRLAAAGVPLLAGTDTPVPGMLAGVSLHQELGLLVAAGLTPAQALAAATSAPAAAFGWHDRGRIAVGARADLVLVEGDPTRDIGAARRIVAVWKRGQRVDREAERRKIALFASALATYQRKEYGAAVTAAEQALAIDPSDGDVAYLLACVESLSGKIDGSLTHVRQAVDYDPTYSKNAAADPDLEAARGASAFAAAIAIR